MKRIITAFFLTTFPIILAQAQAPTSLSTSALPVAPNTFTYSQPNSIPTFDRIQKYRFTDVPTNFWAFE